MAAAMARCWKSRSKAEGRKLFAIGTGGQFFVSPGNHFRMSLDTFTRAALAGPGAGSPLSPGMFDRNREGGGRPAGRRTPSADCIIIAHFLPPIWSRREHRSRAIAFAHRNFGIFFAQYVPMARSLFRSLRLLLRNRRLRATLDAWVMQESGRGRHVTMAAPIATRKRC
jgi:hypothetical protein